MHIPSNSTALTELNDAPALNDTVVTTTPSRSRHLSRQTSRTDVADHTDHTQVEPIAEEAGIHSSACSCPKSESAAGAYNCACNHTAAQDPKPARKPATLEELLALYQGQSVTGIAIM